MTKEQKAEGTDFPLSLNPYFARRKHHCHFYYLQVLIHNFHNYFYTFIAVLIFINVVNMADYLFPLI